MSRFRQILSKGVDSWLSFFAGFIAVALSIVVTALILAGGYALIRAVVTQDYSAFIRKGGYVSPVVDVEPMVVDTSQSLTDSLRNYTELIQKLDGVRTEFGVAVSESGTIDVGALERRLAAIEELVQLKPEQIASLGIMQKRVEDLQADLKNLESSFTSQIGVLNNWMLGLFGVIAISLLLPYVMTGVRKREVEK